MDVPRRKTPHIFTCLQCGKTVETYPSRARQQFCSRECSKAHAQQAAAITKTCLGCGKSYTSIKARNYKLYCSQECYTEHREKSRPVIKGWKKCVICNKDFKAYNKGVKCCSPECRKELIASKPKKSSSSKSPKVMIPKKRIPLPKYIQQKCAICGDAFQAKRHNGHPSRQTCSMKCMQALIWEKQGGITPPTTKRCKHCSKEFTVPKKLSKQIYCSQACSLVYIPKGRPLLRETINCLECGTPVVIFPAIKNRKKFCSRSCLAKHRIRNQCKNKPTSIEIKLYESLDLLGVNYIPQYGMGRYVPDAWLPDYSTIIEADGTYWHSLPDRQERDRKLAAYAKRMGYPLIRLDEMFIKSIDVHELAQHIKQQLS